MTISIKITNKKSGLSKVVNCSEYNLLQFKKLIKAYSKNYMLEIKRGQK